MKTDKQTADNLVELHSEKVRNIIGDIPSSLVRWGVAVIVIIVLGLALGSGGNRNYCAGIAVGSAFSALSLWGRGNDYGAFCHISS